MTQQIEPCPNCKMPATRGDEEATDHATEYSPVGYHMRFFCCCVQCGMKGPIEDLPELADGNWNRIARAVREASELSHLAGYYLTRAEKAKAERDALRERAERLERAIASANLNMLSECLECEDLCCEGPCRYIIELPKEQE